MSFCLNPECQKPQNADDAELCAHCGTGLLLRKRYRAIAPIGQGGFGRTFLAIDEKKKAKPRCVIKQFLPLAQTPQHLKKAKALFKAEAARLKELGHHPQIPALLAHISQGDQQYLVQEFIDGKNLEQELQTHGAFTEAQIREVLTSLLPVLDFIHNQEVIHRDLKPANILRVRLPPATSLPQSKTRPASIAPIAPDWAGLLQALARETEQGFRDGGTAARFSLQLSQSLAAIPPQLGLADYTRCQQFAAQFVAYDTLSGSQRQYLVADASRTLYEMRRRYESLSGSGSGLIPRPVSGAIAAVSGATAAAASSAASSATFSVDPAAVPSGCQFVLVDFGAAKAVQTHVQSQTGTVIGSPEYLAPEQAMGKALYASDLYSLGVTCLHLLTQRSPLDLFDPQDHVWAWRRHLKQPISNALGQILDKLISQGTNRRYPSAAAALQDLQRYTPALVLPAAPVAPALVPAVPLNTAPSSWECVHHFSHPGKLLAIALSPTAPILASSSGTTIRLWDLQSGQPMRTLTGHIDIIPTLGISPDGQILISGSADKTIRLWDIHTGQRLGSLSLHTSTVLALALSPNGQVLASSSMSDPIILWDFATGLEQHHLPSHDVRIDALTFTPDNAQLVSGGGDALLRVWDVATGTELKVLTGHTGGISVVTLSPDGKTLASGSSAGEVKLWSMATRRLKRSLPPSAHRINALVFSPSHKTLLAGSSTLQLWNPRSGAPLEPLPGHTAPISALVMSPFSLKNDPRQTLVTASLDGMIRVWQGAKI
jgi:WD40 repeat protein